MKAIVAVLALVFVAGCGGVDPHTPSRVVVTPGGSALVLHRLPDDVVLPSVRAVGRLRLIGGPLGCLGFVRGVEDVVVLFPPGSRVHRAPDGPPSVTVLGLRYGVGDVVSGQPWNAQPVRIRRLSRFDRALPTNCRGFRAQAFVDLNP